MNYHAMLLGGALGDAIGSAIEFTPWSEIVLRYGPKGLQEPAFRPMNFTDDTQMTLFAAEAVKRHRETGCELLPELRMSIRYWHATQNIELNQYPPDWYRHPLIANAAMLHLRSPGHTCLQYGDWADGTLEYSINSSKGNGGAMRIAPLAIKSDWCCFGHLYLHSLKQALKEKEYFSPHVNLDKKFGNIVNVDFEKSNGYNLSIHADAGL